MICSKCHHQNTSGSQFCNRCGAKLVEPKPPKRPKKAKGRERRPAKRREKPAKNRNTQPVKTQYSIVFVFLIVLAVVIAAGAFLLIPRGDPAGSTDSGYEAPAYVSREDAVLEVESTPVGASLFVDNDLVGRTPVSTKIAAGTYSLRLEHPDYQKKTVMVRIESGEQSVKRIDLDPLYILEIPGNPPDALVKIDGSFQGKTPTTITWEKQTCELVIEKEGWSTYRKNLVLDPGKNVIEFSLDRASVRLSVRTDPDEAQVYLDGEFVGKTPFQETVSPGARTLRVQKEGYRAEEERVDLRSDANLTYTLRESQTIQIKLSAHPWAEVFIDGKSIGNIPPIKEISITVGPHTFEFVRGESRVTKKYEVKNLPGLHLHMDMESGELREIKGQEAEDLS